MGTHTLPIPFSISVCLSVSARTHTHQYLPYEYFPRARPFPQLCLTFLNKHPARVTKLLYTPTELVLYYRTANRQVMRSVPLPTPVSSSEPGLTRQTWEPFTPRGHLKPLERTFIMTRHRPIYIPMSA